MNESIFGSLATRTANQAAKTPTARVVPRRKLAQQPEATDVSPDAEPLAIAAPPSLSTVRPAPAPSSPSRPPRPAWSVSSDVAVLAILESPIHAYETVAVGFARKESELRHIFSTLSILESRVLHSRLSSPLSGDQLAQAFTRLTADRRARLINFLADARRREATKGTHRVK
jgi:hypothetical protein